MSEHQFRFRGFELNLLEHSLTSDGKRLALTPKEFATLRELVVSRGAVVRKEQLLEAVWPGTFVAENSLTRNISVLRKTLGPDCIETVPKIGYRFAWELEQYPPVQLPREASQLDRPAAMFGLRIAMATLIIGAIGVILGTTRRTEAANPSIRRLEILTSLNGEERHPKFSPDGKRVAFSWRASDSADFRLYVRNVEGGSPIALTQIPAPWIYPEWSPDGAYVYFARAGGGGNGIFKVPSQGGKEEFVAKAEPAYVSPAVGIILLSLSKDGRYLSTSQSPNKARVGQQVFVTELATGVTRQISKESPYCYGGAFSPDSHSISYSCTAGHGMTNLYNMDLSSGSVQQVTSQDTKVLHATWSREGRSLIYSTNTGIWSIRPGNSTAKPILIAFDVSSPDEDPGGDRIVYEVEHLRVGIYRTLLKSDDGNPRAVCVSTKADDQPSLSPDGSAIAFTSTRSGNPEIWTANADGSNPQQLATVSSASTGTPRWSPDGKYIVFDTRRSGRGELAMAEVATHKLSWIEMADMDAREPSFSRDGGSVYFTNPSEDGDVWVVKTDGKARAKMLVKNAAYPLESSDGSLLYFIRNHNELWQLTLKDRKEQPVAGMPAVRGGFGWMVARSGIYFIPQNSPKELHYYDPFTHSTGKVALIDADWGGFSIAQDESAVVFAREDDRDSDLMLTAAVH